MITLIWVADSNNNLNSGGERPKKKKQPKIIIIREVRVLTVEDIDPFRVGTGVNKSLNGNNGSATNTDDLDDHQQRRRARKEARNHLYRRPRDEPRERDESGNNTSESGRETDEVSVISSEPEVVVYAPQDMRRVSLYAKHYSGRGVGEMVASGMGRLFGYLSRATLPKLEDASDAVASMYDSLIMSVNSRLDRYFDEADVPEIVEQPFNSFVPINGVINRWVQPLRAIQSDLFVDYNTVREVELSFDFINFVVAHMNMSSRSVESYLDFIVMWLNTESPSGMDKLKLAWWRSLEPSVREDYVQYLFHFYSAAAARRATYSGQRFRTV